MFFKLISNQIVICASLQIAFYASLLAGEIDTYSRSNRDTTTKESSEDPDAASGSAGGSAANNYDDGMFVYFPYYSFCEDDLEKELGISCMDCRIPLVPLEEFYNEPLSDAIQMDRDYLSYKNLSLDLAGEGVCGRWKWNWPVFLIKDFFCFFPPAGNHFSFMLYSFILTPATKVIALYYDSRIRMYSERNSSLYSLFNYLGDGNDVLRPDLKLKVRRDNIVNDALIGVSWVVCFGGKVWDFICSLFF